MSISSNCGTAVDVVGPICQGPKKTHGGHSTQGGARRYLYTEPKGGGGKDLTWNPVIHGALLMAACVKVCGDCW